MHKEPVFLSVEARRAALEGFVGSLTSDRIPVVCAAIDSHHFHVLIKCPPGEARKWVGRAKGRSAMALYRSKLADGKVWTIRFKVTAVKDRAHQTAVANYIVRHASKGAAVWRCDRDGTAKPTD